MAPVGAFVVLHVLRYSELLLGQRSFGDRDALAIAPFELALELLLVGLPLTFHAVYGVYAWLTGGVREAPTRELALTDRVQRVVGVLVLVYVVAHFVRFRWPLLRGEVLSVDTRELLVRALSSTWSGLPLVAAFELLGVMAVAFHLGYGLYRFDWRWPWLAGGKARTWLAVTVGLVVLALGSLTLLELATGKTPPFV